MADVHGINFVIICKTTGFVRFSAVIFTLVDPFVQGGAKRTHVFEMGYLPAICFFGVTSNQKSTFENLVQSTI
jgi:hypothetical protein